MSRVNPVSRDIELMVSDLASPEARSARLATFAAQEIAETKAQNRAVTGRDAPYEVTVDGVRNAPLTAVRSDGVIVAEFDLVGEVLEWIGEQILLESPRLTGRFMQSHILLADDVQITPGAIPDGVREFVFVNTQPYARKIEGDIGRPGQSDQAPDGVYEGVAATADKRFGNVARVYYGYHQLPGMPGRENRQPAIIVRPF